MSPKKHRKLRSGLQVKRSRAGLGLFAARSIKKDQRVIEYTGPIISGEEADRKGGKYLFEIDKDHVIDGSGRDNIARYINHSCRPNCEAEVDGTRVFIYAKRKIEPGEELSYHYGKGHFEDLIKPDGCRCNYCSKKE